MIKITAVLILLVLQRTVFAQNQDSIKNYNLDEITVKSGFVLEPKSVTTIEVKKIEKSDAGSVNELGKFIPSVKVQTNSRGESLFYLRGSGERQIALFFDGVPLNIPWDNRIDLSMIPADAVGEISVTKGIPSVIYGANASAGVINIISKEFKKNKAIFSTRIGENNYRRYSLTAMGGSKKFNYMFSASHNKTDGFNLPYSYSNPANESRKRINSFGQSQNIFGRVYFSYQTMSDLAVSFAYNSSEKGVPPETNVTNPRLWKYPEWRKTGIALTGSHRFDKDSKYILAYAFSVYNFSMRIDQYKDVKYSSIDDIEKDDDNVYYARLIFTRLLGTSSIIKFAASSLYTVHSEKFMSSSFIENEYAQNIFSAGLEYEYIGKTFTAVGGVSFDGSSNPMTGDKGKVPDINDYGINTALVYPVERNFSVRLNLGRKTRFPTMREAFSEALGRFIINPSLKAEVVYSGEAGSSYIFSQGNLDLTLFLSYLEDGIVRTIVESSDGNKFMRINSGGIRTVGIEFDSHFNIHRNLTLSFNVTYGNSSQKNLNGEYADTLEYKPAVIAGLNVDYTFLNRFNLSGQFNYTGKEFALREGSRGFQRLPDYLVANLRLAARFELNGELILEPFLRVNNFLDKIYYSQWGLPEAGRQFWAGFKLQL